MSLRYLVTLSLLTFTMPLKHWCSIGQADENPHSISRWSNSRNNVSDVANIPTTWNLESDQNIKWSAKIEIGAWPPGFSGRPVVDGGRVYLGSNNVGYVARFPDGRDLACLLCFDESDGKFLWQYTSPRLKTGRIHDWPTNPICSTPYVEGDRLWFVTNRCEVVCLDTDGFYDGKNEGPYVKELTEGKNEADVIWKLDMMGELDVRPHNLAASSVTGVGELIYVNTGNGVAADHSTIEFPDAPSFLAIDKKTGRVVWSDHSPGTNILHGQWSSPAYGVFDGQPQVIFAGGDGWLYGFDPQGDGEGAGKLLWKFDCNPKTAKWDYRRGTRNNLVAMPVVDDGLVYITVGQEGEHGFGQGHLWCIDPTKQGDVSPELVFNQRDPDCPIPHKRYQACDPEVGDFTRPNPNSALVWHYEGTDSNRDGTLGSGEWFDRTISNATIKDGILYAADLAGTVHCLDAKTGKVNWTHKLEGHSYHSPLLVDNRVYVGDEDTEIVVFEHSRKRKIISKMTLFEMIDGPLTAANGVLYLLTRYHLYAIEPNQR